MTAFNRTFLVALLSTLASACGASEDSAPANTTPTVRLDLTIQDLVADEKNDAVPDVKVCVDQRPEIPCVMTDAAGKYALAVPSGEDLVLSYEKADFFPKLRLMTAEAAAKPHLIWYFQRKTWYASGASAFQGTMDFSKAILTPQTSGEGIKFELSPMTGVGPMYGKDVSFLFDTVPTETSNLGVGAFVNVEPGSYTITYKTSKTCTPPAAWKSDVPNSVRVTARAGWLTYVFMGCT